MLTVLTSLSQKTVTEVPRGTPTSLSLGLWSIPGSGGHQRNQSLRERSSWWWRHWLRGDADLGACAGGGARKGRGEWGIKRDKTKGRGHFISLLQSGVWESKCYCGHQLTFKEETLQSITSYTGCVGPIKPVQVYMCTYYAHIMF